MWICPICKTTNETNICRSCGFDLSKDYAMHRFLCQLSASSRKISKPVQPGDNILMASSNTDYVFGRKMDRTKITTIYFRNKKENIGEDAWDVSEKQNGSIMAWTEENRDGFKDLYLAANGNILANKDCSKLFMQYEKLEKIVGLQYFQTDQTENMSFMFDYCKSLASLDVSHFDTSQVTDMLGMLGMFNNCERLASLDVSHFDTSQVTDMSGMFAKCKSLASLDVSHFDTSQVTSMDSMFYKCESLASLDVSHFDTSQVTDMHSMFADCESLASLDVSHFDTSQVTRMESMFAYCESLASLDVSHFDTSQVTDMPCMFASCGRLVSLDVSHFDTSQVTDMSYMFHECNGLKILDISNFDTSNVKNLSVPLSKYLAVPQGVCLKKTKENGFFRKLWEKLSN